MRLLTKEESESTFSAPMVNVTGSADEIVELQGKPRRKQTFKFEEKSCVNL